jgi:hypothetical protein
MHGRIGGMTRIIVSIGLILLFSSVADARVLEGYGVKTGVVIAEQDFDYAEDFGFDTKNRAGLDVGVYLEWLDIPSFGLLTEAHYVQKGMVNENPRTDEFGHPMSPVRHSNRVDYLSIPILAKVTFRAGRVRPYVLLGPRIDFLLGYESRILKAIYDGFEGTNLGGTVGLGIERKTKRLKVLLELRYSPDFTDAFEKDGLKVKNNSFDILFGLGFQR